MNIFKFTKDVLFDHQTTINWCMDHRLIPREKRCPKNQCRRPMIYDINNSKSVAGRLRCLNCSRDIKIMRRDPFISFIDAVARFYPGNYKNPGLFQDQTKNIRNINQAFFLAI